MNYSGDGEVFCYSIHAGTAACASQRVRTTASTSYSSMRHQCTQLRSIRMPSQTLELAAAAATTIDGYVKYTYVYMYVCICLYMHMYLYVYACECVHVYA